MVKVLSVLFGVVVSSAACGVTADPYEGGDKFAEPRPYVLTPLKTVEITLNGAWTDAISGDETPQSCAGFVLQPADVREFLQRANRASHKEYTHDLGMSRCHATGRLQFANGDRGEWQIDRERRGRVSLSDGRNLYFHCDACQAAAFGER